MTTATRITTPFGFSSTAAEVVQGIDFSGKRVIITGATSGIGLETARTLAGIGADVTLAVRNTDAGAQVAADITAATGNANVHVRYLELVDRASIDAFVNDWGKQPLDVLINNAGVMAIPELQRTSEGWEVQFATNHLGHFALALGLHDALAAAGKARIVSVSSSGHMVSPVVFDDIHYAFRRCDRWGAYGQSKTANVLFAVGAAARWANDGIAVNAVTPGGIQTNLQRHSSYSFAPGTEKTVEQGATTPVLAAVSPLLEGIGGRYFADCNESEIVSAHHPGNLVGVAPYALDPANAERLWDVSLQMLGRWSAGVMSSE